MLPVSCHRVVAPIVRAAAAAVTLQAAGCAAATAAGLIVVQPVMDGCRYRYSIEYVYK